MDKIIIERIFIHNNFLCIKVPNVNYNYVYRSGMSVGWDAHLNVLFYNGRETTNDNKINIIIEAVLNEYGESLIIDESTIIEI